MFIAINGRRLFYRLLATNNFPEFTGRICPAPCEGSCVLGINADPVTIKNIEVTIIDRAFKEGIDPGHAARQVRTGKPSPLSDPARRDLAAAAQLNQAGHWVTVFERADRIGGLLRYGIPEFKMEKHVLDRRLNLMHEEGVMFRTNANVGVNVSVEELRREFDAILLAGGATAAARSSGSRPRAEWHSLRDGLSAASEQALRRRYDSRFAISSRRKTRSVVIIGGGDTGADCLGTAHRQGAARSFNSNFCRNRPQERAPDNPWPNWPNIFRTSSAHEEGGDREFCVLTKEFHGPQRPR